MGAQSSLTLPHIEPIPGWIVQRGEDRGQHFGIDRDRRNGFHRDLVAGEILEFRCLSIGWHIARTLDGAPGWGLAPTSLGAVLAYARALDRRLVGAALKVHEARIQFVENRAQTWCFRETELRRELARLTEEDLTA